MPGQPFNAVVPPPSQWNRRVRAAVHYTIAQAPVRGRRGQPLGLQITYLAGRKHLPIVELKKAA